MKLIPWLRFKDEIEVYTITKEYGDLSYNNPDRNLILHNRTKLLKDLSIQSNQIIAPNQTHSTNFKEVTIQDGGLGFFNKDTAIKDTDALYTKDNNLTLMCFHADCTPIVLYCPSKKIIATIHAGWTGTVNQITIKITKHLLDTYHIKPNELYAYIGPCISNKHFEVKIDVINKINTLPFDTSKYYKQISDTHYLVDNKKLNQAQLEYLNIPSKNIDMSPYCTIIDNNLLFSHRKKETGRSITIAKIK